MTGIGPYLRRKAATSDATTGQRSSCVPGYAMDAPITACQNKGRSETRSLAVGRGLSPKLSWPKINLSLTQQDGSASALISLWGEGDNNLSEPTGC